MLYIPAPAVEEIRVCNLNDEPMFNGTFDVKGHPNYGQPKPLMQKYSEWLLARVIDETFLEHSGKKEGIDAIEIMHLARQQIRNNVGAKGVHMFDDEVAQRLRQAIIKPKLGHISDLQFEHNWYEWVMLWKAEPLKEIPAVYRTPTQASEAEV